MSSRLVLVPQGMPVLADDVASCVDVIRRCGGDILRIIDSPSGTLEAFANHVRRLKAVKDQVAPLIVLHRTNPLALAVIASRRELEKQVPSLHQVGWIIVHNPVMDPFFEQEALDLGEFDDPAAEAPIWSSPGGLHYLVVRPGSNTDLRERVLDLLGRATAPPAER
jgi:hypothetical protein